ncbi:NEFA-interacting nuclear protein NIP30, partial [Immersiella caudata]
MSSRFVSAGAIDAATGKSTQPPAPPPSSSSASSKKSKEWLEKSLYEVLQANKAAKQSAFEEANKIKNQFRALDDDEIDFLEGVREKKR